jgi:large subunit ribosomal protein L36e
MGFCSMSSSGISVGLKKGFVITKRTPPTRNVTRKAQATRRSKFVKEVCREVAGFAPYERRLIDLCRNNLDKRALRLAKRKLGTHTRAKRKREEMSGIAFRLRQEAAKKAAADKAAVRAEEEAARNANK